MMFNPSWPTTRGINSLWLLGSGAIGAIQAPTRVNRNNERNET